MQEFLPSTKEAYIGAGDANEYTSMVTLERRVILLRRQEQMQASWHYHQILTPLFIKNLK